jgi:hypothetical protein
VLYAFVQEVDDLYARAIKHFKDDAMIHVFAAQYYNIYRSNHRIEQIHLSEAEVRGGPDSIECSWLRIAVRIPALALVVSVETSASARTQVLTSSSLPFSACTSSGR